MPNIIFAQTIKGNAGVAIISSASEPFGIPPQIVTHKNTLHYQLTLTHKKNTSKNSESTIPISSFKNLSPHQKSVLRSIYITAEY